MPASNIDELIEGSQGLVRSIALKIHSKVPRHVLLDDLIADGQVGLIQAARAYKSGSGASFSTFAYYRIRGAIYDGLSKMNWSSRSLERKLKAHRLAGDVLDGTESDCTNSWGQSVGGDAEWLRETTEKLAVVYLASQISMTDEGSFSNPDSHASPPDAIIAEQELFETLRSMIASLPEPDRSLIRWAYYDGLSLTQIAKRCGHHKAWASRLHSRILKDLSRSLVAADVV